QRTFIRDAISPLFFSLNPPAPTAIYTLSLHDALPISAQPSLPRTFGRARLLLLRPSLATASPSSIAFTISIAVTKRSKRNSAPRSEEHTSELQSRGHLVCRLLLEKKKQNRNNN